MELSVACKHEIWVNSDHFCKMKNTLKAIGAPHSNRAKLSSLYKIPSVSSPDDIKY